jgi:WD40 repeat protein
MTDRFEKLSPGCFSVGNFAGAMAIEPAGKRMVLMQLYVEKGKPTQSSIRLVPVPHKAGSGQPGKVIPLAVKDSELVHQFAFSPDGKKLLVELYERLDAEKRRLVILDTTTWKVLQELTPGGFVSWHPNSINLLVWSGVQLLLIDPTGVKRPLVIGRNYLWSKSTHQAFIGTVAWSYGGKRLAVIEKGRKSVSLWDTQSNQFLETITIPKGMAREIGIHPVRHSLFMRVDTTLKEWSCMSN